MTGAQLNQAAGWLAERLLNGVPAGMVIAFAAWILLRLVGRKNSSTRFAVWFSALVAIGASPLLGSVAFGAAGVGRRAAITVPSFWGSVLLAVWGVIAAVAFSKIVLSLGSLRKLRSRHEATDAAALDPMLQRTLSEFQMSRKMTLAISDELRVPTAMGFLKPMIILPRWAMNELSPGELNAILIHELAHLKRWDDCTNLAQKVIRAMFFFNPAVCWIENRLSLEREMACDDVVLARTANARAYAECLVSVAEKSFVRRGVAMAQAAVSRMRQTSRRITQILDAERPGATRVWRPAWVLVTIFSAACAVTLSRAPELIAFQPVAERPATVPMLASNVEKTQPALLIPAVFKTDHVAKAATKTRRKPARLTAGHVPAIEARLSSLGPPMVVAPAGASGVAESQLTTQTVLVVMQARDGAAMPSWTLCIWRVTFVNSSQIPAGAKIPAKQI
jgi:beta-lactamase regulating signal transducer with metallopeptidase domain